MVDRAARGHPRRRMIFLIAPCRNLAHACVITAGLPSERGDHAMDAKTETLIPAEKLAREGPIRVPGESAEYRAARTALLAEEIELRRHIERVAAQRRALPPGAEVTGDYRFMTEDGPS